MTTTRAAKQQERRNTRADTAAMSSAVAPATASTKVNGSALNASKKATAPTKERGTKATTKETSEKRQGTVQLFLIAVQALYADA